MFHEDKGGNNRGTRNFLAREGLFVASVTGFDGSQGQLPIFFINISAFSRLRSDVCSKSASQLYGNFTPSLARMLSLYLFIALALLGLSLPANTAPSPQLTELRDGFVMNDNNIIPFDPNYYIPINPYTPTDPVLEAQTDEFSASGFEFNSATEPVILAQISDQGVVPNPDYGNLTGDPDIEAGDACRKTKALYCCKGRYESRTLKVAQPCMPCTLSAFSSPQLLYFRSKHTTHAGRTENAIFCNHATFYCCSGLDVGFSSFLPSVE